MPHTQPAPAEPVTAYVGMGANLGDAARTLQAAAHDLARLPGIAQCECAPFYRTAPVDAAGPDYVNTVARVRTVLSPWQLLDALQALENRYGRQRPYRNAPRTLDLDLLLYEAQTIHDARLTVPHPRMHERAFVLAPLAELAPALRLAQGAVADLLAACHQRIERLAPADPTADR